MIYLISAAGLPNYGDELIARTWLRFLAEHRPEDEVWLDCQEPGMASVLFQGTNPTAHFTNTVWRVIREAPVDAAGLPDEKHVRRIIENLGSSLFNVGLLKLREATSLHLLGGGYITDLWPRQHSILAVMVATRAVSGSRLYGTGLELIPTANPQRTQQLVEEFEHFSVRDMQSAQMLGIQTGLDDAFLGVLNELDRTVQTTEVPDLVLCLQPNLAGPKA